MLTIYDAALASEAIYSTKSEDREEGPRIGDWTRVMRRASSYDSKGNADAYWVYRCGDELLFVIRGTDRRSDWTDNNFRIGLNITPAKATEALLYFQHMKRLQGETKNCYITGHSLGGGLAQLVGYYTNTPFVAFNPPPMRNGVTGWLTMKPAGAKEPKYKSWEFDKGCIFRSDKDPVSRISGRFIGATWTLPIGVCKELLDSHSMSKLVEAIGNGSVRGISRRAPLSAYAGRASD